MKRLLILLTTLFSLSSMAAMKSENVEYKDGETVLEGYLAHNPAVRMKQPAILIVHDWMGLNDFAKKKADEFAKLGYVAFAADIYGKGVRPKDQKEAGEFAGKYKGDRKLMRSRVTAALETLKKNPKVDANKIVAIGFCFGGTTVAELAMTGAPLAGVVTIHGGLDFPNTLADVKNMKTKVLILHGALDPYVPAEQVQAFLKALNDNKIDYTFTAYSGAVHAFTVPEAGTDPSKGAAYNPVAEKRAMEATRDFIKEVTQ